MSKEKIRDLLICIIAVSTLVFMLTTHVFATDVNSLLGNDDEEAEEEIEDEPEATPTNTNKNVNTNNTVNNKVNNTNKNVNTNTATYPNAGVDYSIVVVIAVCGVSAVYAYKKIKDYSNL